MEKEKRDIRLIYNQRGINMNDKTKEIPINYYTDPKWMEAYKKSSFPDTHTFEEYIGLQRNLANIERWRRKSELTSESVH